MLLIYNVINDNVKVKYGGLRGLFVFGICFLLCVDCMYFLYIVFVWDVVCKIYVFRWNCTCYVCIIRNIMRILRLLGEIFKFLFYEERN